MSRPSLLALKAASFRYGTANRKALAEVNLSVCCGERLAVLGESGSGKSTLLGLLSGLLSPTSGAVLLDGHEVSATPPHQRQFALVLQQPPVLTGMTVGELLLRPASRENAVPSETIARALSQLGISGLHDRRLSELSGGQRQRVHLARTLVWKPRFMLLDEPFNSIDVHSKHSIYPVIQRHQMNSRCAMILVTHDPQEAFLFGERIVVMRDGQIVADVPATQLLSTPPNVACARLVSGFAANVIEVDIDRGDASRVVLRSCLVPFRGVFRPFENGIACPEAALVVVNWSDVVGIPAVPHQSCAQPVFTSLQRQEADVMSPVLFVRERVSIYGRPSNSGHEGVCLVMAAKNVLLYDAATEKLLGRVEIELPQDPSAGNMCPPS